MGNLLDFPEALREAFAGNRIRRAGWNGKGTFVVLMPQLDLAAYNDQDAKSRVNDRTAKWVGKDRPLTIGQYFAILGADGVWQPGWVPSQRDMFADDWEVVVG